jgi:hypothetical protein
LLDALGRDIQSIFDYVYRYTPALGAWLRSTGIE